MATWASWLPDLMPHLPGCPRVLVIHELRRAAQKFFAESRAWKVIEGPFGVSTDDEFILLTPPESYQTIESVDTVWFDGRKLSPTSVEELDSSSGTNWRDHVGQPTHFLQMAPGELIVYPRPPVPATVGVKARMCVGLNDAAKGISDEMAALYRDAIVSGAKARLMAYTGKPWTNLDMAGVYGMVFAQGVSAASLSASRGHVGAPIRSRVRWC